MASALLLESAFKMRFLSPLLTKHPSILLFSDHSSWLFSLPLNIIKFLMTSISILASLHSYIPPFASLPSLFVSSLSQLRIQLKVSKKLRKHLCGCWNLVNDIHMPFACCYGKWSHSGMNGEQNECPNCMRSECHMGFIMCHVLSLWRPSKQIHLFVIFVQSMWSVFSVEA